MMLCFMMCHHRAVFECVLLVGAATGVLSTVVGDGTAGIADGSSLSAQLFTPSAVALSADESTLYICDSANASLRSWSIDGGEFRWQSSPILNDC